MKATIIEQGCTTLSPPLLMVQEAGSRAKPPEVRFLCQRPAGHPGVHSMVFRWESTEPMVDSPPWKGSAS